MTPAWGPCGCPGRARSWGGARGGEQDPKIGDLAGRVKEQPQGHRGTATGRRQEGTEHQTTRSSNKALVYWVAGLKQQSPWQSAGGGKVAKCGGRRAVSCRQQGDTHTHTHTHTAGLNARCWALPVPRDGRENRVTVSSCPRHRPPALLTAEGGLCTAWTSARGSDPLQV